MLRLYLFTLVSVLQYGLIHEKSVFCLPTKGAFFNEIHPIGWEKSPAAVKSLRGEIRLDGGWVDFISP